MESYEDIVGDVTRTIREEWENNKNKDGKIQFTLGELCRKMRVFPNKKNMGLVADSIYVLAEYDAFGYTVKDGVYTIHWTNY